MWLLNLINIPKFTIRFAVLFFTAYCLVLTANAQQKVAIIVPDQNQQGNIFAEKLQNSLTDEFKIIDSDLSKTAFQSNSFANPYNLSLNEAKNIGAAIGCDFFLLIRSKTVRRFSFENSEHYESYAIIYTVSARTGRLVFWKLESVKDKDSVKAETLLLDTVEKLADEISDKITKTETAEINEKPAQNLEELPEENSPQAKNFRSPLPYKRIRPIYTDIADLYEVEATVDIELDLNETGEVIDTKIIRWAGFGLDESVTKIVREMNWRPASRNGKTLPIRVLLRYNFKKVKNEK